MFARVDQIVYQADNYWLVDVGLIVNDYRILYIYEVDVDPFGNLAGGHGHEFGSATSQAYGEMIAFSLSQNYPAI